jgi:hypothetical protein
MTKTPKDSLPLSQRRNHLLTTRDVTYLRFFEKAHTVGKFTIDCEDLAESNRVRMKLFRLRNKFLDSQELQLEYPQFVQPLLDTEVSFKPKLATITIYRCGTSDFDKRMLAKLEMTEEDGQMPASAGAKKSEADFIKKMGLIEEEAPVEKQMAGATKSIVPESAAEQARRFLEGGD